MDKKHVSWYNSIHDIFNTFILFCYIIIASINHKIVTSFICCKSKPPYMSGHFLHFWIAPTLHFAILAIYVAFCTNWQHILLYHWVIFNETFLGCSSVCLFFSDWLSNEMRFPLFCIKLYWSCLSGSYIFSSETKNTSLDICFLNLYMKNIRFEKQVWRETSFSYNCFRVLSFNLIF